MASMSAGLFVLSQDAGFLEQLHERLSNRFDLVVADSLAAARASLSAKPVGAALAHLAPAMLNGTPVRNFLAELKQVVSSVPIYGLIDPQSPPVIVETWTSQPASFSNASVPAHMNSTSSG